MQNAKWNWSWNRWSLESKNHLNTPAPQSSSKATDDGTRGRKRRTEAENWKRKISWAEQRTPTISSMRYSFIFHSTQLFHLSHLLFSIPRSRKKHNEPPKARKKGDWLSRRQLWRNGWSSRNFVAPPTNHTGTCSPRQWWFQVFLGFLVLRWLGWLGLFWWLGSFCVCVSAGSQRTLTTGHEKRNVIHANEVTQDSPTHPRETQGTPSLQMSPSQLPIQWASSWPSGVGAGWHPHWLQLIQGIVPVEIYNGAEI